MKRVPWEPIDYSGWTYTSPPCSGDVLYLPWWNIMMGDTLFANEARCHWDYFRQHSFHSDSIDHYIDSMALLLHHAQARHFTRWPILGINTGTPEVPPFSNSFHEEIDTLKSIVRQRMQWMDVNLPGHCHTPYNPFPTPIDTVTSVQTIGLSNALNCYPNPATNTLQITYKGEPIVGVRAYNTLGQLMFTETVNTNVLDQPIDCSKWPAGLYLIAVQRANDSQVLSKVMKE